jgi:hypothetical protein
MRLVPALLFAALALPFSAAAQHFGFAAMEVHLIEPDSVRVSIEVDAQDLMNTVYTFPLYADTGEAAYRLYERRLEQYMQTKVKLRADGKPVNLAAVQWKRDGKGRHDGLDSVSIQEKDHYIALSGKVPKGMNRLSVRADLWDDRDEVQDPPRIELALHQGDVLLRRMITEMGRTINFSLHPDSVAKMKASFPPRVLKRPTHNPHDKNVDHTGHNH